MKRVYSYPLIDWISAALHTDSLKTVLRMVKSNEILDEFVKAKADNRRYIEKVLKEEVQNQFCDYRRPMLEVILNSIDAKPNGFKKEYNINIKVKRKDFSSADIGKGMSLDDILRFLIIPFNTEKKGIEEIGRFGVGFLSAFNYCLAEPKKVHLTVETRNGSEGYMVDFYATSNNITNLMMCVAPISSTPTGTKVSIKWAMNKKIVIGYLKNHLENMPSYISKIMVNGHQINDDSKFRWYIQPVSLKSFDKEVNQQVGFRASEEEWGSKISLALQGVLVKQFRNDHKNINATVSFPPAVQVVEGRDEFKIDDNYNVCVDAVLKAFEEYLKEQKKDEEIIKYVTEPIPDAAKKLAAAKRMFINYMTGFIPSLLSALGVNDISKIPNMNSIREILFPGKKYVLTCNEIDELKPFFKEFVEKYAFEAQSYQSQSYWKDLYKPKQQMLDEILKPVQIFKVPEFVKKFEDDKSFYPNLHLIAQLLKKQDKCKEVCLVDLPPGDTPLFIDDSLSLQYPIYINTNHPYIQGELNHSKVYALVSEYLSLKEARSMHNVTKLDDLEESLKLFNSFLDRIPEKDTKKDEP